MAQGAGQSQFIVFVVILLLIVILRMRRIINGTRVSLGRTIGYSIYYVLFASLFILSSYFEGISSEYFILYALIFIASALVAYKTVGNLLHFWKNADGSIFSKGGMAIYLTYIAGLIARIAIGFIFIGPSAFNFTFSPTALSPSAVIATIVTDILLVFGAGMLVGRNMQILKRFFAIKRGEEQVSPVSSES